MTDATSGRRPTPLLRRARWVAPVLGLLLLLIVVVAVSGCGSSSSPSTSTGKPASTAAAPDAAPPPAAGADLTGTGFPNVDASSLRRVGGPIDSGSVDGLKLAWSHPIEGSGTYGSYASSPVISRGVIYSQDLGSNVEAIDLKSGRTLWRKAYDKPSAGPNGVNVADGRVYGATSSAAFALDQRTGKELWSVTLAPGSAEGIDMAPGYHEGLVYVSTVPVSPNSSDYSDTDVGILYALDAKTGRKRWEFETLGPGRGSGSKRPGAAGGGLWYAPSFDGSGGMYFGVGNPSPYPGTDDKPWGSSRPGPNLYSNSLVKLDARTGKLRWYYQQTPHDLYDWDFQCPPILVTGGGRKLAICGGKSGVVVAVDRSSGKVVWKRPVGKHNGHDRDGVYAMKRQYEKLKTPTTIYPGVLGGVISPMATDGKEVFVPVVDNAALVQSPSKIGNGGDQSGLLVAISVRTGKVTWKTKLPSVSFGATSVVNDLVFVTTIDGKVLAYGTKTGELVWSDALPSGTNTGVTIAGDTLVAPAGLPTQAGQAPQIVAYRLPASK